MTELVWDESWSVGVPKFDGHHRRMMELINDYVKVLETNKTNAELASMLMALFEYTKMHFNAEEAFLRAAGFPALESHTREHDLLAKNVLDYHYKLKNDLDVDSTAVMEYLKEWLVKHINTSDRQYTGYASSVPST